jgi:hypothetical protein
MTNTSEDTHRQLSSNQPADIQTATVQEAGPGAVMQAPARPGTQPSSVQASGAAVKKPHHSRAGSMGEAPVQTPG